MINVLYAAAVAIVVLAPVVAAHLILRTTADRDSAARRISQRVVDIYNLDNHAEQQYSRPLFWAIMAALVLAAAAFLLWSSPIPEGLRAGVFFATLAAAPQFVIYSISKKESR